MIQSPGTNPIRRPLPPLPTASQGAPTSSTTRAGSSSQLPGMPAAPIQRPPTPGHAYVPPSPLSPQDAIALQHHDRVAAEVGNHNHPDNAMRPSSQLPMSQYEMAAAKHFRDKFDEKWEAALQAKKENVPGARQALQRFEESEFSMTYRIGIDGAGKENIFPVKSDLVSAHGPRLRDPEGFYPAGTFLHIHSHPLSMEHDGAFPSHLDQRHAFNSRTNQLHQPGTDIRHEVMYHPHKDRFYAYDGSVTQSQDGSGRPTGPTKTKFHELENPFRTPTPPPSSQV